MAVGKISGESLALRIPQDVSDVTARIQNKGERIPGGDVYERLRWRSG